MKKIKCVHLVFAVLTPLAVAFFMNSISDSFNKYARSSVYSFNFENRTFSSFIISSDDDILTIFIYEKDIANALEVGLDGFIIGELSISFPREKEEYINVFILDEKRVLGIGKLPRDLFVRDNGEAAFVKVVKFFLGSESAAPLSSVSLAPKLEKPLEKLLDTQ